MLISIVGTISMCITISSYFPQAYASIKAGHAKDLAWGTIILVCCGAFSWTLYGLLRHDLAITITNTIVILPALAMVYLKITTSKTARDQQIPL